MRDLVIGLGNPLLTDDGVGPVVARALRTRLPSTDAVTIVELALGGLALAEAMVGFDRVIVIDALSGCERVPGTLVELEVSDASRTWNTCNTHDTPLGLGLALLASVGQPVPAHVRILGIAGGDLSTFGESLTDDVAASVPRAVAWVVAALERKEAA